tara:strand:+ start:206 stop:607 length:402 start_codon:yes stop_codon:yes gene_type:complete
MKITIKDFLVLSFVTIVVILLIDGCYKRVEKLENKCPPCEKAGSTRTSGIAGSSAGSSVGSSSGLNPSPFTILDSKIATNQTNIVATNKVLKNLEVSVQKNTTGLLALQKEEQQVKAKLKQAMKGIKKEKHHH